MIGAAIPSGLFGLVKPTTAPMQDVAAPAAPFVYGEGGSRLTPEMITQRSRGAQSLIAAGMDTSPVGSWTQGLARIAQALVGNMQQNRLDKQAEQNAAASAGALSSLGTGDEQMIASILANPYLDEGVKDAAKLKWQAMHRAPQQPSEFERTLLASGIQPGSPQWVQANQQRLQNYTDPTINIPLPGGRVYVGPRSGFTAAMGGGDQSLPSSAGATAPPATLPPDFDFDAGGPTQPASAGFR